MRRAVIAAIIASAGICLAFAQNSALSQTAAYPAKPIKIIVPFPPGGATDILSRLVGHELNESWKQAVVVENKAGANGMIGADLVAKSPADGYTWLTAATAHAANVSLFPNAPYQFQRDLQALAVVGLIPLVPVVRADSPIRTLQDLVAMSKAKDLNGGSSGSGTTAHLGLELFKSATGARIQHVPYKGGAPAMTDLLGGQIDVIFALLPECLPYIKAGRLRALAVTSAVRHPLLPGVPTTAEAGISGIEVTGWNGFMVAAGTPANVVSRINAEISRIAGTPDMKNRIVELGYQPVSMSVVDTEKFVRGDVERWAKVIRDANIKAD